MSAASDYSKTKILEHMYRNTAYTSPSAVYLALYTAAPNDAGGGTELSGNGYARQAITFGAESSGTISNSVAVTDTASGGDWGTITHWGIFDAVSGGNLLSHGALNSSVLITDGDTITIAIGDIDISQD